MALEKIPFDPGQYDSPGDKKALINDALASGDPASVGEALRTAMQAPDLNVDVISPEDPRLGIVLAALNRLGIEVVAMVRASQQQ